MLLHTRYRDIPWEEVLAVHPHSEGKRELWESLRGKAIQVQTPGVDVIEGPNCREPHYPIFPFEWRDRARLNVCPHIAEIGD